jgi:5'-phosphate synthase pdxT subunit
MGGPVGVLALQGGVEPHRAVLGRIGVPSLEVRTAAQLQGLAGLVLPGGESTAMRTLLRRDGMLSALAAFGRSGRPVLATCAGLILAADPELGWLDVDVRRNAYGRQLASFVARSDQGDDLVFIRAPRIDRVGPGVHVLARCRGEPVLVQAGTVVGATFHPELSRSAALHAKLFA